MKLIEDNCWTSRPWAASSASREPWKESLKRVLGLKTSAYLEDESLADEGRGRMMIINRKE